MINTSVIDIQKHISSILKNNGINKVFEANLPKKIMTDKVFAVLRIGELQTRGQFQFETYGICFAYIDIYVKALSDMEMDSKVMRQYEEKINNLIISQRYITDRNYSISDSQIGSIFTDENRGYHVLQTTLQITVT
jgi:hypothetical protein